jgi:thiol-disulfide isomerase/thioredoxin
MRRARAALLLGALLVAPAAAADAVKLILPAQYRDRIVAPRKGRVLVVNFWATWCEPCREEIPGLAAAARGFPSRDVAVVLVSLDSVKSGPESVPKFLTAHKVPFVCWLAKSHDPQEFIDAVDRSWDGALPYTLIYGRDGRPGKKLLGKQSEKSFAQAIRDVLGS